MGKGPVQRTDVLIAGAGPTGMVLALWLERQGVRVRIVDRAPGPGTTSRALAVQARTLELYRQLDLTETLLAAGHRVPAVNLWTGGRQRARLPFETIGAGLTPYPYMLIYPQDAHERLLEQRLLARGIRIERETQLTGLSQDDRGVRAVLRHADGRESTCQARFLAGCDGASSTVRKQLGIDFPGGTYSQRFYVADVQAGGATMDGGIHIDLEQSDFLAVFGMSTRGHARLVGTIRDDQVADADALTFADVSGRILRSVAIDIDTVNWFSTYRVHHRVAERFRAGRAFLAGDAAHIHSPAGGQGMNTGIGDAINLAWKLAAVVHGQAGEDLLDTYQAERIGFARRLVRTTDRVFSVVSSDGRIAGLLRTVVAPWLVPLAWTLPRLPRLLFQTISQTRIHYRSSRLSNGVAGRVRGGDRLPWAPSADGDNFAPLRAIEWQVHVYGVPSPSLVDTLARMALPLHAFEWQRAHGVAGLERDAAYLIRPDGHVALADPSASGAAIERYFAARGLRPRAAAEATPDAGGGTSGKR
jgi:2-polyprenyl-6-methoxyphenol hydroxylase-like FAD-dependent oxidoreductase